MMKQNKNTEGICPCCGRHCPAEDLHCPRGRSYFGAGNDENRGNQHHCDGRASVEIKDETVRLLLKCGHTLHHGLREKAAKEDILSFLSPEEKDDLTALLEKCIKNWDNH
ncbi:MAG: hypothetical protein ACI4A5_06735 [Hominilimicola sp.]